LKNFIIGILQVIVGFNNYLLLFSCNKILFLRFDRRKKDFLRFVKMIPNESNVLIIGANTGITTVPVARRISSGKIIAFEPVAQNVIILKRVLHIFRVENKVSVVSSALGNSNGSIKMVLPVWGFTKKHGFAHVAEEALTGDEKGIVSESRIQRLDDVEELRAMKINYIKIVAENYEYNILSGGKNLIEENRPVIYCELWDNDHRLKTLELIKSFRYQVKVFRDGNLHEYNPAIDKQKYFFFFPL